MTASRDGYDVLRKIECSGHTTPVRETTMKRTLKRTLIPLAAFGLFVVGCGEPVATTPAADDLAVSPLFNAAGPIVHRASLGGADICEALGAPTGCDANFSLVANEKADGSVSGQWEDSFGGGEGIHVAVDCLNVVGNFAEVGGVITHGTAGGADVSGQRAVTAVVDNGTSANDPADQLSFSIIDPSQFGLADDCTLGRNLFETVIGGILFDLAHGQVVVR